MAKVGAAVRFIDRDKGLRAWRERLARAGAKKVKVGIFGERADQAKQLGDGFTSTALSLIEVATIHEFGAAGANIPERSFIRATIDIHKDEIHTLQKRLAVAFLARKMTEERALKMIGVFVRGLIQKRIAEGVPPELKPKTIQRKGSSVPLIDTGQLRQSVTYEVDE